MNKIIQYGLGVTLAGLEGVHRISHIVPLLQHNTLAEYIEPVTHHPIYQTGIFLTLVGGVYHYFKHKQEHKELKELRQYKNTIEQRLEV